MDLSMRVVADEINKQVKMYPTPTASDIEGGAAKDVQMKDGRFFRENKKGERWGVKPRGSALTNKCFSESPTRQVSS